MIALRTARSICGKSRLEVNPQLSTAILSEMEFTLARDLRRRSSTLKRSQTSEDPPRIDQQMTHTNWYNMVHCSSNSGRKSVQEAWLGRPHQMTGKARGVRLAQRSPLGRTSWYRNRPNVDKSLDSFSPVEHQCAAGDRPEQPLCATLNGGPTSLYPPTHR